MAEDWVLTDDTAEDWVLTDDTAEVWEVADGAAVGDEAGSAGVVGEDCGVRSGEEDAGCGPDGEGNDIGCSAREDSCSSTAARSGKFVNKCRGDAK